VPKLKMGAVKKAPAGTENSNSLSRSPDAD
jgi:hypothetical protein